MVPAGIFFILFGTVVLLIASQVADNMVNRFRQFGSEMDPNIFKFALWVLGLFAIILGLIEITRALR